MMYIEGDWETVDTLKDIVRVIKKHYNSELAEELNEQIEQLIDAFKDRIEQMQEEIDSLRYYDYDDDDCYND